MDTEFTNNWLSVLDTHDRIEYGIKYPGFPFLIIMRWWKEVVWLVTSNRLLRAFVWPRKS